MIFNSVTYLLFLSAAVVLFWTLPMRARLWMIFLASLVFYGFWRPEFVLLMLVSAGTDFVAARRIEASGDDVVRRRWLLLSIGINLSLLFYFKYLLFFVDNMQVALNIFGVDWTAPALSIVLPLGISFYTFQTISYTVDVYRRFIPAERDFLLYGCFVTFFPQLVAGPILRGSELLYQLSVRPAFHLDTFASGLQRITFGLFLKVAVADNVAPFVDEGFSREASGLSALDVLTLAFLFGFQIYCDFSAYSHIAIGSARLMGIRFPENFDFPYISCSPREFWRRWHISLSSWVRDYLYLPLLGVRVYDRSIAGLGLATSNGMGRNLYPILVLFLTWLVMGLWHGANWTFVLWGLYHATFIGLYRVSGRVREALPMMVRIVGGWGVTLLVGMLAWIPFRAQSIGQTMELYARLGDLNNYTWLGMRENTYLVATVLMSGFLLTWWGHRCYPTIRTRSPKSLFLLETVGMGLVFGLVFVFLRPISQFIYFQF